ncbi:uncharacterized protein LOC143281496 [Babylonia areolata]|uniref:uncharacterized protein LOC143281496 n=1 Tax=Babylonia areolata TaxID=304850 RepID=UPI003FD21558
MEGWRRDTALGAEDWFIIYLTVLTAVVVIAFIFSCCKRRASANDPERQSLLDPRQAEDEDWQSSWNDADAGFPRPVYYYNSRIEQRSEDNIIWYRGNAVPVDPSVLPAAGWRPRRFSRELQRPFNPFTVASSNVRRGLLAYQCAGHKGREKRADQTHLISSNYSNYDLEVHTSRRTHGKRQQQQQHHLDQSQGKPRKLTMHPGTIELLVVFVLVVLVLLLVHCLDRHCKESPAQSPQRQGQAQCSAEDPPSPNDSGYCRSSGESDSPGRKRLARESDPPAPYSVVNEVAGPPPDYGSLYPRSAIDNVVFDE